MLAVALVAAVPDSPLQPVLPPWVSPAGPFHWLAQTVGLTDLHGDALVAASLCAVVAAAGSFLWLALEAWRGRVSVRLALMMAVIFNVAILALPLLISRDVYSYSFYGRIAGVYHANPYVLTPGAFRADPLMTLVGPKWVSTPDVYGPLFTMVSSGFARSISSVQGMIDAFRLVALCASLGTILLIGKVADRLAPSRTAFAVIAFGANPLVVFESVASGHNDLLVGLCVIAAAWLLLERRDLAAVVVLSLGALVKATAAVPLLLLIVALMAGSRRGSRARTAVTAIGPPVFLGALCAAPFFQTKDPTLGMATLAGHEGWLAPSRLFDRMFTAVAGFGILARIGFALLLVGAIVGLGIRVARSASFDARATIVAFGWALVALMLLGPVLLPWYAVWALPLAALLPRVPRLVLLGTSAALTVSEWAAEPARYRAAYNANVLVGHYVITPVVVLLTGWLVWDLWRRLSGGLPLDDPADQIPAAAEDQGHARRDPGRTEPETERVSRDPS
jgi:hypothetical protein